MQVNMFFTESSSYHEDNYISIIINCSGTLIRHRSNNYSYVPCKCCNSCPRRNKNYQAFCKAGTGDLEEI